MESITIHSDFTGILCIDDIGISAYDLKYNPITFDLTFDTQFNIHDGSMYQYYKWQVDYNLCDFLSIGQGVYYINMKL